MTRPLGLTLGSAFGLIVSAGKVRGWTGRGGQGATRNEATIDSNAALFKAQVIDTLAANGINVVFTDGTSNVINFTTGQNTSDWNSEKVDGKLSIIGNMNVDEGAIGGPGGDWSHEVGHMFGLSDAYSWFKDTSGQVLGGTLPGFETNPMGFRTGSRIFANWQVNYMLNNPQRPSSSGTWICVSY